jgi:hypothetical protein
MHRDPLLRPTRFASRRAVFACLSAALAAGCSSGGFGSELASRPVARPVGDVAGRTLRIPQDEKFSIRQQSDQDRAELGGHAQSDAQASTDGSAAASAEVRNGGTAEATFQLGHAVANDSDRQMELTIRVRCKYELDVSNTPPTLLPDAFAGLNLYARDGRNRLLRTDVLVGQSTEQGSAGGSAQVERTFVVTLGPRDSLAVFVAGNAKIDVKPERSARATLNIAGLELEFTPRLAPPISPAGG